MRRLKSRKLGAVILAAGALLMLVGFLGTAAADHIPSTGTVPANCVEFQAGQTGTKSPTAHPDVDITLVEWFTDQENERIGFRFTISGLDENQFVDLSVKAGDDVEEDGPYGNGTFTFFTSSEHAISHVRFCKFTEGETTTTTERETTTTTAGETTTTTAGETTSTTAGETTTTTAAAAAAVAGVQITPTTAAPTQVAGAQILPVTGPNSWTLFAVGMSLILGGLILVFGERHYRPRHNRR